MKRLALYTTALALASASAFAGPKAIYVKKDDGFRRYSFGVASPLTLSPDLKYIHFGDYNEDLQISDLKYISFNMPMETALSPTQHKDRLIEIGEKINDMIDANDMEEIIGMCVEFDNISDYDGEAMIEKFKAAHPDIYDEDYEYYRNAPAHRLLKAMKSFAKGKAVAARSVTEIYTETFNAGEFTGVFVADHDNEEWVKTADADYFEIKYTGKKSGNEYCLRITPSPIADSWKEELLILDDYVDKYWGDEAEDMKLNLTLNMPQTIDAVMTVNGKTVATTRLKTSLNKAAKTIALETTVSAVNKYAVTSSTTINNSSANENLSIAVNGKTLTSASATVNGSDLLNIQGWIDALQAKRYEDDWEIWLEPDYELLLSKFKNANSRADFLGELQVVGNAANFSKMRELLDVDYDDSYKQIINHDKGTITSVYDDPRESENEANVLNNYTDASFFYDGTPHLQGFLSFEASEYLDDWGYETDGYWDNDTYVQLDRPYMVYELYHETTPILNFADGSSFAFDSEYFEGGNFSALVNDYDNIVDIVDGIISSFRVEREPYYPEYPEYSEEERLADFENCYNYTRNEAWFGRNFWEAVFLSGDEAVGINLAGVYDDNGRYRDGAIHNFRPDLPGVGLMGDMLSGISYINSMIDKYARGDDGYPLVAPLRAMRAYYHFWMMDLYGDVPILDHTLGENETTYRVSRAEVAYWIEHELLESINYLEWEKSERTYGQPTRWMAMALLAKLYLNWGVYTNDIYGLTGYATPRFNECVQICDEIINSGMFDLGDGYRKKFFPDNGPQINDFIYAVDFDPAKYGDGQWKYAGGHEMNRWWDFRRATYCKPTVWGWTPTQSIAGIMILTPEAVDRFCLEGDERNEMIQCGPVMAYDENFNLTGDTVMVYNDARFRKLYGPLDYKKDFEWANISTFDVGEENHENCMKGARLFKYPIRQSDESQYSAGRFQYNDIPVFRYADILLTKAECMLSMGYVYEAINLVNQVRACSHAPFVEGNLTLDDILDERGREFILEPWRRNDLIRFGKFENCAKWKVEASPSTMQDVTKRLFPIPTGELNVNPSWSQNPGY